MVETVGVGLVRSRITAIPSFDFVITSLHQKLSSLGSLTQPAKGDSLHYHQNQNTKYNKYILYFGGDGGSRTRVQNG